MRLPKDMRRREEELQRRRDEKRRREEEAWGFGSSPGLLELNMLLARMKGKHYANLSLQERKKADEERRAGHPGSIA